MRALDLTDLPIADAMEVAEADLNHTVSEGLIHLDRCEQTLRDLGAPEELYLNLERERAELISWRERSLAELRGWLERDGAVLN